MVQVQNPSRPTLETLLRDASQEVTHYIARESPSFTEIAATLEPTLRVAGLAETDPELDRRLTVQTQVTWEIAERATPYLDAALRMAVADHAEYRDRRLTIAAIRSFFLEAKRMYGAAELAGMFGTTPEEVLSCCDPVELREINGNRTVDGTTRIPWRAAAVFVLVNFKASELEDALGDDFNRCLPPSYRTQVVTLRLSTDLVNRLRAKSSSHRQNDVAFTLERELGGGEDPLEPSFVR